MRISIVLSLLLFISACKEPSSKLTSEIDPSEVIILKSKLKTSEKHRDSLQLLLENYIATRTITWFGDMESKSFKDMGIENPKNYLLEALRANPSVIPLDGILGGTMFFTDIEILGTKWIIASYEDGHIMGRSIFTYKINPETMEVEFAVLDQVMDY